MLAVLRKLHAWLGLGLCLVLALIALTGAAMVFKPELRRLAMPEAAGPAPDRSPEALARVVEAAEAHFGPGKLRWVTFASDEIALHEANAGPERGGAWLDVDGKVIRQWAAKSRPFDVIFDLHHQLLGGDLGETIVGTLGLMGALMAISGVVLWWPARRAFRAAVLPRQPTRAGWLAAHRDLAIMTAPLVLLSMLSGAAMALPDVARPLMNATPPTPPRVQIVPSGPTDWRAVVVLAQGAFPAATIRLVQFPAQPDRPITVRLRQPGEWHTNGRTLVHLSPGVPRVVGVYDAQAQNPGARAFAAIWPIHAAKVGGWPWKVAIFLSGLSLAALSLYGGEAYRRRLFPKR